MAAQKTVIIIAGPTAVGKTSAAIMVAKHFQTEIISADSRQCYRELNIGVARPSEEELAAVPHHFIASHSIQEKVTAATFEQYALQKAFEIFRNKDVVIMVGGTGLYIKAFEEGLDPIPSIPDRVREQVQQGFAENGLTWLQEQVRLHDPQFYAVGEIQNPHRLMRALEVVKATGTSIISFRKKNVVNRPFKTIKLALQLPKEALHQNINFRVEQMVAQGLEQEAKALFPFRHLAALQTVGYQEWFSFFNGEISKAAAIEAIKIHTRQYAKRQLTWFRKDPAYQWLAPNEPDRMLDCIHQNLLPV